MSARTLSDEDICRVNGGDPFLLRFDDIILQVELECLSVKLFLGEELLDRFIFLSVQSK